MRIRGSEIQCLVKYPNKKLIIFLCKYIIIIRRNSNIHRLTLIFAKVTKQFSLDTTDVRGAHLFLAYKRLPNSNLVVTTMLSFFKGFIDVFLFKMKFWWRLCCISTSRMLGYFFCRDISCCYNSAFFKNYKH